ncbi:MULTISPECIES: hypothetical protein [Idiomarina]|jgi:prefoldin subunit 5|uniref:hypothetical protein n=1 Tax=Idiomarina TaxID=135575 RepID=UPI00241C713D|nr:MULTISPECIES: hypothetical protein [Idiomarina]|tara:strand:- start:9517 stop:9672 length:156 start_codon:yes stop_codon:yes gene_type:complete
MDNDTYQALVWVNAEIKTFEQTIEQIQAHLHELHQLRAELISNAPKEGVFN